MPPPFFQGTIQKTLIKLPPIFDKQVMGRLQTRVDIPILHIKVAPNETNNTYNINSCFNISDGPVNHGLWW